MAGKNIKIANASYPDVPSVVIPLADGSGNAKYVETSDATATASDLMAGTTAYVGGQLLEGTFNIQVTLQQYWTILVDSYDYAYSTSGNVTTETVTDGSTTLATRVTTKHDNGTYTEVTTISGQTRTRVYTIGDGSGSAIFTS